MAHLGSFTRFRLSRSEWPWHWPCFLDNLAFLFLHTSQWRSWKFWKEILKSRKLKIPKVQNSTFVKTTEKKIQKFGNIQKGFEGREVFAPMGYYVNENKRLGVWTCTRARNNWNLKEICPMGSEILATRARDGRQTTKSHTISPGDTVKQS